MADLLIAPLLRTITTTGNGETLFHVAAAELGDATQWTRIARLNGLSDPFITGGMRLTIPPIDSNYDDGGILG